MSMSDSHFKNSPQYALVLKGQPIETSAAFPGASLDSQQPARRRSARIIQEERLLRIYESYAENFPNPRLIQEYQTRDQLLRAVSAADHAVSLRNPPKEKRGFFSKLVWGAGEGQADDPESNRSQKKSNSPDEAEEDDRLLYKEDESFAQEDDFLLQTTASIDVTCIPSEAHAMARLTLASTGKGHRSRPNVARSSWETACGNGNGCIVLTGLGTWVEFSRNGESPPRHHTTTDREYLEHYFDHRSFELARVRAATIGPNLMVVAWGGDDGYVVFYRRLRPAGWESVACLGASKAVRDSMGDFLHMEGDQDQGSAELLVTDVVPLVVEMHEQAPAAALAVSRLGGFVEFVPLPPQMWYGPEMQISKSAKRKYKSHYAAHLPDLARQAGGIDIAAVTTADFHSDIIGLEAFRTSVDADDESVEWNQDAYPNGPPAEHVLAAHGTKDGLEVITFWSVSTIIAEPESNQGIGFSTHASFLEAFNIGTVGPDICVFASPKILRYWRRPRNVELRADHSQLSAGSNKTTLRVTTLSITAPVVSLRFSVVRENENERRTFLMVWCAVLDLNGGVTVLDCSFLERAAAQTLSVDELSMFKSHLGDQLADVSSPLSCVTIKKHRSEWIGPTNDSSVFSFCAPLVKDIQWLPISLPCNKGTRMLTLATYVDLPSELRLHCFALSCGNNEHERAFDLSRSTVVPFHNVSDATLCRLERQSNLLFLICHEVESLRSPPQLILCALQEINYADLVQWYFRTSKFREAMHAAKNLSSRGQKSLSDIIERSKMQLWESELDLSALEAMSDHAYIVKEAMYSPSDQQSDKFSPSPAHAIRNGSLALFRSVCQLALLRIKSASFTHGASLSIASSVEDKLAIAFEIEKRLVKAATYELLCKYLCFEASLDSFLTDFLPTSVYDLSLSFARRGDVLPLSILWFRHQSALAGQITKVLDQLPLAMPPHLYRHLLPVSGSEGFPEGTGRFIAGCDSYHVFDWSDMPDYLADRFGLESVVDEQDKIYVLENIPRQLDQLKNECKNDSELSSSSALELWYCNRTAQILDFAPSFVNVLQLIRLALCALGVDLSSDAFDLETISPEVEKLYRLKVNFDAIRWLLFPLEANISFLPPFATTMKFDDFENVDSDRLLETILSCTDEDSDLVDHFRKCVLPILTYKCRGQCKVETEKEVDSALEAYCMHSIAKFEEMESQPFDAFLSAIQRCSVIVASSKTSLMKSSRLIQNKKVLVSLVIFLCDKVIEVANAIALPPNNHVLVVDELWKMYEALPTTMPSSVNSDAEVVYLLEKSDCLYRDIVFLDIVSRWPGISAVSLLLEKMRIVALQESPSSDSYILHGEKVVAAFCASFRNQVEMVDEKHIESDVQYASSLLNIMLQDIHELNEICFQGNLPLKTAFFKHFFKPLLLQKRINLLGEFLRLANPDFVDLKSVSGEVYSFFKGAMYDQRGDGYDGFKIKAAIECSDVLGKWLPELHRDFETFRSYLEATSYINEILLENVQGTIGAQDLQSLAPLDVIDLVLRRNPGALILHCKQWGDQQWAKAANLTIRSYIEKMKTSHTEDHPSSDLPPLPGHPIFHLAQLLGFDDDLHVVSIKILAVQHALSNRLYGAAAAIFRTLLVDNSKVTVSATLIFATASKIISEEKFDDHETKDELCALVLAHRSMKPSMTAIIEFENILAFRSCAEHHCLVSKKVHFQNDKCSIHQLYVDTHRQYGVDMDKLFLTLNKQLCDCLFDVSLLLTMTRYSVFWCISRCTRPRNLPISAFDTESTRTSIYMAMALILHVRISELSRRCLDELNSVFVEQRMAALNSGSSYFGEQHRKPDPNTVKHLVGRGYSESGARRAVVMTDHSGFETALKWAVLHSFDVDFDNPIIAIKPARSLYIDKQIINEIEGAMMTLNAIYSGAIKNAFSSLAYETVEDAVFSSLIVITKNNTNSLEALGAKNALEPVVESHIPRNETVSKTNATEDAKTPQVHGPLHDQLVTVSLDAVHTKDDPIESGFSHGDHEVDAPTRLLRMKIGNTPSDSTSRKPVIASKKGTSAMNSSDTSNRPISKNAFRVPNVNQEPKLKIPANLPTRLSDKKLHKSLKASTTESVEPGRRKNQLNLPERLQIESATSKKAPLDRSSLLEFGQAAFETARKATTPSSEERQSLIEQGRLLLRRAKKGEFSPQSCDGTGMKTK